MTTQGEGSPTWIVGLRREARMAMIEPASVPAGAEVAAFALNEYEGERAWRLLGRSAMAADGFRLELREPVEILLVEVRQPLLALDADWADFRSQSPQEVESIVEVDKATNYRDQGKKERQAAQMPELLETVRKAREALRHGVSYPSWASRKCKPFKDELWKLCEQKIEETTAGKERRRLEGKTESERQRVWREVVEPNLECWWVDGCAAPTVK